MFDLPVFLIMCVIAVTANAIAIPKVIAYSEASRDLQSQKVATLSALMRAILLSLVACAIGAYTAPRVGLSAPLIESIINLDRPHVTFLDQLLPALVSSIYVLSGLVVFQISYIQRHVTVSRYFSLPLSAKILLEGVVEEVIFRWGLMSVIARILSVEFQIPSDQVMIIAIVMAAVGSSLSHVSDLSRLNFDRISNAVLTVILINFWGAICYGWLFWKYGLSASVMCHILVAWASVTAYKLEGFVMTSRPAIRSNKGS